MVLRQQGRPNRFSRPTADSSLSCLCVPLDRSLLAIVSVDDLLVALDSTVVDGWLGSEKRSLLVRRSLKSTERNGEFSQSVVRSRELGVPIIVCSLNESRRSRRLLNTSPKWKRPRPSRSHYPSSTKATSICTATGWGLSGYRTAYAWSPSARPGDDGTLTNDNLRGWGRVHGRPIYTNLMQVFR